LARLEKSGDIPAPHGVLDALRFKTYFLGQITDRNLGIRHARGVTATKMGA
jgi:hypothetical protein